RPAAPDRQGGDEAERRDDGLGHRVHPRGPAPEQAPEQGPRRRPPAVPGIARHVLRAQATGRIGRYGPYVFPRDSVGTKWMTWRRSGLGELRTICELLASASTKECSSRSHFTASRRWKRR